MGSRIEWSILGAMTGRRRGRPTDDLDARQLLISTTRELLLTGSAEALSSRAIARRAGVSHSLVNYHFGSRADLVAAALDLELAPHRLIEAARGADGSLDPLRLVTLAVAAWEQPRIRDRLLPVARAAASDPVHNPFLPYLQGAVQALTPELGRERASRILVLVVGTIFARHLLQIEPLADLPPARVHHLVQEMLGAGAPRTADPTHRRRHRS